MSKLNASAFAAFLMERAARKDGYIMGAIGQDPKKLSNWYYNQYSGDQKKKALYWRDNAERVWDCQGLVEGYINDRTGAGINVRARNNYATWCDPKGSGRIPDRHKLPGAAVFLHSSSAGAITHVGFLVRPVDAKRPAGDWHVVEARGVMYGVVTTKLDSRPWNRWGLMTKYFDYGAASKPLNLGDRELKRGMTGDDVKQLQEVLIAAGYDCGRWGADGDFGPDTESGVRAFQTAHGLKVNGVVDADDVAVLKALVADNADPVEPAVPPAEAGNVRIEGGNAYLRTGPGTQYAKVGVARKGERYAGIGTDGWVPVVVGGEARWVSAKYAREM